MLEPIVRISVTSSGRQLALRRPDRCPQFNARLARGTRAWWDPASRTVTCLECVNAPGYIGPPDAVDPGEADASALREHQRRRDARDRHAREKLGAAGGLLADVIDEPASARAWQQGGNGEVQVAARLEKLLNGTGIRLLHDRRVPGHGHANIDGHTREVRSKHLAAWIQARARLAQRETKPSRSA